MALSTYDAFSILETADMATIHDLPQGRCPEHGVALFDRGTCIECDNERFAPTEQDIINWNEAADYANEGDYYGYEETYDPYEDY